MVSRPFIGMMLAISMVGLVTAGCAQAVLRPVAPMQAIKPSPLATHQLSAPSRVLSPQLSTPTMTTPRVKATLPPSEVAATPTVVATSAPLLRFKPLENRAIIDRPPPHIRALTDGKHKYKNVVWGPNSRWLAATPQDGPGLDAINSTTGQVIQVLTDTFALEPVWDMAAPAQCSNGSTDTAQLLVQRISAGHDQLSRFSLCNARFETTPLVISAAPLSTPALAGDMVVYSANGQLIAQIAGKVNALQSQSALATALTKGARPWLAWTPRVNNLETVATLIAHPSDTQIRVVATPGEGWWLPVWSSDGTRLALSNIDGRIGTMALDTGRRYDLGPGETPAWSPDGQTIAFAGSSAGEDYTTRDIHLVDWQGHGPRLRLTRANPEQIFVSPSWSPDGKELAFVEIDSGKIFIADRP